MNGTKRLNILSESQTLSITKLVRKLKAEGQDIIGLTLGEPDFNTPDHIRAEAIKAIEEGFTHYTPVSGILPLRKAIAQIYIDKFGLDINHENIVASTGAKQSLVNSIMSIVDPGQEAILPAPYWVSYREMLKMAEAKTVVIQTELENSFKMTPEQLEAAITPNTRLLLLNSPNNPTGCVYSKEELAALVAVLEKHPNIIVISDEIYEHITFEAEATSLASFPSMIDRLIIVNGVSKGYAMTGWRLGFVVAPKWIAALCEKFQGQVTSGTCSITQRAAVAAFTGPMEPTKVMRDEFLKRRDIVGAMLHAIPGLNSYQPTGAFYFYPDLSNFFGKKTPSGEVIKDVDHLCEYLIKEGHIAVIPGTAFGTKKHVRISYAYALPTLEEGIKRFANALNALK